MSRSVRAPVSRPRKNSLPSVRPGETTFAVIPRGPSSAATSAVHASTAAFAAGHALIERGVDGLLRHEDALLSALTPEQRTELAGLLRILLG